MPNPFRTVLALLGALLPTACRSLPTTPPSALQPAELRCEHLEDPLAVGVTAPQLSWRVVTDAPERRGQGWQAWRVQVASSLARLEGGTPDRWDSGWRPGPAQTSTTYGGEPLSALDISWWRVQVRAPDGTESPFSTPARFGVGRLDAVDWQGDWIGLADADGDGRTRAPWLRRTIDLPTPPRRAWLHVASVGYHEVHVNGAKAGDAELAPSVSDLSARVRSVTYDLTDSLGAGRNAVGLWLGPGWSRYPRYGVAAGPLVRAVLDLEFADGSTRTVATGPDWRVRPSHVEAIGGSTFGDYGGERVDAGQDLPDWSSPRLDDADWAPARVFDCGLSIVPDAVEPNRRVATIRPVAIEERRPGVWRVDMGRAFTGITEARLRAAPGATIRLSFAERDDQDVTYAQRSELVVGPDGEGTFRHRFSYAAARWITIEGAAEAPRPEDIRGFLVRSGYARAGAFTCSDALLQQVLDVTLHTFECLSLGGYVVDCAHRERWGYGGDAHATMETALGQFELAAFYQKWLDDWRAIQDEFGNLPFTCPTFRGGGGPAWSGIVVMLPWEIYRRTGDRRLLEQSWPTIERWLAFLETKTEDGELQLYFDERYTRDVYSFLGDWVPPGGAQAGGAPDEKRKFFNNAYRVWAVRTAAQIAEVIEETEAGAALSARADELAAAVHARFFDADRGVYVTARQTYYALPILAGLGTAELREDLFGRLVADVTERRHVDTGIHGTWFLVKLLLERGRVDLLHLVATQRDFPSWGHMLDQGATTIWEQWDGINSRMHSSFLSIGAFFVEGLLGIRVDVDGLSIAPAVGVGGLERAAGGTRIPQGSVRCAWQVDGDRLELEVEVPVGATAEVRVPTSAPASVRESGQPLGVGAGILSIREEDGAVVCEVGSGRYRFTATR